MRGTLNMYVKKIQLEVRSFSCDHIGGRIMYMVQY